MFGAYYDELETRAPERRERDNLKAVAEQVARVKARAPYYKKLFAGIEPAAIASRADLARLPVTRKNSLIELMKTDPPFGGINVVDPKDAAIIFTSPGPIFEFCTARDDYYGGARALYAAGFRKGDVIHNSFAYHLTPGAWIIHLAAGKLGCPVVPGGVGNTEHQVQVMAQVKPVGYGGTPDFLKTLLETGDKLGVDLSSVKKALVGGGPLFPQLREFYKQRGIAVFQTFATAELGNIAYETSAMDGMVVAEDKIVEVVIPGTDEPVAELGQVGEMVVTSLNPDCPLIRFSTGDLTALMPGLSPCGRTNARIKGWMGRADQTTKVRGMFVHPEQVAEVMKRHKDVRRVRLVVDMTDGRDFATLKCESAGAAAPSAQLIAQLAETFQSVCKVRAEIEFVAGVLPNDGKLIDDVRKFT